MQLIDVLDERIIDLNAEAANEEEVLALLAGKLKGIGCIADAGAFKGDIYLRESKGTTGVGNYITIPHRKSDSVTQVGIIITKLKYETEWEILDDKGVHLAFLFTVSNDHEHARNHILLLADITRKLGNGEAVECLLQVENVEELKGIFAGR